MFLTKRLALVAVLSAGVLAGCGSSKKAADTTIAAAPETSAAAAGAETTVAGGTDTTVAGGTETTVAAH